MGFLLSNFLPKLRLQIQLKHALNQTTDVVAEYLAKRLVDLRRLCLTPQRIPELRLYHVERAFNIRPLVIVRHETLLIVRVEVKHLLKQVARSRALAVR